MATFNRKEIAHRYYIKHKKEILVKKKTYNKLNAKKVSKQRKEYYLKNKLKFKKLHDTYMKSHLEEIEKYKKNYYKNHKQEKQEYNKKYYQKNKKEINSYRNNYFKNRRKIDVSFKILCNLRGRIWEVLKRNIKSNTTIKLLGCNIEQFKYYLESKFKSGMSWNNYGKWHIDHIKPCASFDLSKTNEQQKCFNYTNLQPLWAKENHRKNRY